MNIQEMIQLAESQDAIEDVLSELVGVNVELNRIMARGHKTSPDMLERIADFCDESGTVDEESRRLVVMNPNVPIDLAIRLGHEYPNEFLKNPSFERFMIEYPVVFEHCPEILEVSDCPTKLIRSVAEFGTRAQQYALLKNPRLPHEVRENLSADKLFEDAKVRLKRIIDEQTDPALRASLITYSETSLPYLLPKFHSLDRSNRLHRFDDQLMNGFPFTSSQWIWPKSKSDTHLQPLVQLNLERVGASLAIDLGRGLLQIWGNLYGTFEPVVRVIPPESFDDVLDSFYPTDAPWAVEEYACLTDLNGSMVDAQLPRVSWLPMGEMFLCYGVDNLLEAEFKGVKWESDLEDISNCLEMSGIPGRLYDYFNLGGYPALRLGGFSDGYDYAREALAIPHSNSDERLLLYLIEECVEIAVMTMCDENGNRRFDAHRFYPTY